MAVRQYIGARYVPRFLGTYDATTIYEALDVVDNGAGTSYIARKTVPAGTSLTDTNYWFVYGASSGAIISLQNRMGTAENNITSLQGSITSLNTLTSQLGSDLNRTLVKNAILIGDSWGSGLGGTYGWIHYLQDYYDFDNCYTNSYGGSGFVATGTGVLDKRFIDLITELDGTIPDHSIIDTVIVAGGVNDTGLSNVTVGVQDFVDYVNVNYPNAKVYVIALNNEIGGSITRYDFVTNYAAADGYLKKTYFSDITRIAPISTYVNSLHLNDDGYKICAKAIKSVIQGSDFKSGITNIGRAFTHANLSGNNPNFIVYQFEKMLQIITPQFTVTNVTCTGANHHIDLTPVTAFESAPYPYNPNLGFMTNGTVIISGTRYIVPMMVVISKTAISYNFPSPTGTTATYDSISPIGAAQQLFIY